MENRKITKKKILLIQNKDINNCTDEVIMILIIYQKEKK